MKSNLDIQEKENCALISVNPKIYPLDVVYSAAYMFIETCYVLIDGDPEKEVIIELRPKEKTSLEKLGREFNNELINYANYATQCNRTIKLREAILQRVLLTNDAKLQSKDWEEDPEDIAVPWEEKYGKSESEQREE